VFTRLSARGRLTARTLEPRRRSDQVEVSSVCMLTAEVQQEGMLMVPQSLPVGDDGRCGVRGQRASPELVVRGRWEVCRRSVCQS